MKAGKKGEILLVHQMFPEFFPLFDEQIKTLNIQSDTHNSKKVTDWKMPRRQNKVKNITVQALHKISNDLAA